jgi:Protein of unknown function (DUF3108)
MRAFSFTCLFFLMVVSIPMRAGDGLFSTGGSDRSSQDSTDGEFCGVRNYAFSPNESLTYRVYYTLAGVYIAAGEAVFHTNIEQLNGRAVYHVTGEGKTLSEYFFFKVKDRYETYIDTTTMQPLKFIRNIDEGGFKKYENVSFNKAANTTITTDGVFKVPSCVQDVMSAIYYARNIDFSKMKPNDTIPFSMFLDNQVYHLYIRYMGKETVKTKYGKFRAIKIKPLLIKGTIFEGGEKMTVWVSDDENHVPLRVESPITVGSVKVDMMEFRNRRHVLSALLDLR